MAPHSDLVLAFFDFGSGVHWLIILFVALLLFGRRLPEIMRNLGGSVKEFKRGMTDEEIQRQQQADQPPPRIDGAISRPADPPLADAPPAQPPVSQAQPPADPPKHT